MAKCEFVFKCIVPHGWMQRVGKCKVNNGHQGIRFEMGGQVSHAENEGIRESVQRCRLEQKGMIPQSYQPSS